MTLRLYLHPLASYCWKTLIAFYEADIPFTPQIVDLGDAKQREEFYKLTPLGKFPVLVDEAAEKGFPESSIIIEYLAQRYASAAKLVPADKDLALRVRLSDRFYDNYVHNYMQDIVADRLRPADKKDAYGVEQTRAKLDASLTLVDRDMAEGGWATGLTFTMGDCAAAPALYYANRVLPFADRHAGAARYLDRLMARPSVQRVIKEAEPYFHMFPQS